MSRALGNRAAYPPPVHGSEQEAGNVAELLDRRRIMVLRTARRFVVGGAGEVAASSDDPFGTVTVTISDAELPDASLHETVISYTRSPSLASRSARSSTVRSSVTFNHQRWPEST